MIHATTQVRNTRMQLDERRSVCGHFERERLGMLVLRKEFLPCWF